MTSTRAINAAAGVIHACLQQGKTLPATQAYALDSAGLLNSTEHAAEVEQLRAQVAESVRLRPIVSSLDDDRLAVIRKQRTHCEADRYEAEDERPVHEWGPSQYPGREMCQRCTVVREWAEDKDADEVVLLAEVDRLRARVAELEAAAACITFAVRLTAEALDVKVKSTNREFVEEQLAYLRGLYPEARLVQFDSRHGAWTDVPVVASCLGCGERLDDENISDFCSDRCAEAGSNRPVDEDPIAYSLTVEALHASSGAVIEVPARPRDNARGSARLDATAAADAEATHWRRLGVAPPAAVEDPHDDPVGLHHDYRLPRDLPEVTQ